MAKKKAVAAEAQDADATNDAAEQPENAQQPEKAQASAEEKGGKSSVDREQQRRVVEAIILASPEPIAPARVAAVLPRCNPSQVRALVKELNAEYVEQRRAFEIWEVAGGYQLRSLPEFAPYLKQIQKTRPLRLSAPALETLAVVAYRQPVTRAEIEHIRGVDVGAVLRSLLDRQLVRIAGHREVPGRPIVYATSRRFLEVFGLAKLGDLPTLKAIESLADAEEEDAAEGAEGEITVELAPDEETEAGASDAEGKAEASAEVAAESAENEASDPEDTAGAGDFPLSESRPLGEARLQRILAAAGVASRRAAEEWIRAGRVTVNGRVGTLGERADPARDVVCVDGERLTPEPLAYWIVHKPRGVVTTVRDPEGRPTILSLLPDAAGRLYPVGRLDRDTEGLVLLTNDGPLTHALLHPSHEIEREYVVRVRGAMREGTLRRLAEGIVLDDGPTAPAGVERVEVEERFTTFHLTVIEGRKRQIRRALEALGHPVLGLCRIRMGPLLLGRLAAGEARVLVTHERRRLLRATGLASPRTRKSGSKKARGKGKPGASRKPRK